MRLIPFKRLISAFIGSILFLDGIYLVSLNKIHLGTLLPVLIGFGLLCFAIFYQKIQIVIQKTPLRRFFLDTGRPLDRIAVIIGSL